jgi:hypothetical protein
LHFSYILSPFHISLSIPATQSGSHQHPTLHILSNLNFQKMHSTLPHILILSLLTLLPLLSSAQTVYLIRHGEKPSDDDTTGLSTQGVQRAQCLRSVFGNTSSYNIGKIMAQTPKSSTSTQPFSSSLFHNQHFSNPNTEPHNLYES